VTAALAHAGGPVACAGLACLFVARRRPHRMVGAGALALGSVLLALEVAPPGHRPLVAGALVPALALAAGGALLLDRWPWLLPLAVVALAPLRFHVHLGSSSAHLYLAVYLVAAAGLLALIRDDLRGRVEARALGPLAAPLAAFVVWTGVSLAWSEDVHDGSVELLCFFLPFGVVALCVARLEPDRRRLVALYGLVVGLALAFAGVGLYQYATRETVWKPAVLAANPPLFRARSVFYDPGVYGRFLVVAILATLVLAIGRIDGRRFVLACGAIALLWLGLLVSFSEASLVALAVGALVASLLTWGRRALLAVVLPGVALVLLAAAVPHVRASAGHSARDRHRLVDRGLRIAADDPVGGVGVGAFRRAYAERERLGSRLPKRAALHDTPVIVAAETGVIGLGLLAVLWAVACAVPLRLRSVESRIVGVCIVAIAVHSLFFDAFFEDPSTWVLMGLAAALARQEAGA
jgi:hypothetical protein